MFSKQMSGQVALGAIVLTAIVGLGIAPAAAATRVAFTGLISTAAAPAAAARVAAAQGAADSAALSCSAASAPARMIDHYPVEWPSVALEMNAAPAVVTVLVKLDANGNVLSDALAATSGNRPMDDVALRSVRSATYAPELQGCGAVAGTYFIGVVFQRADQGAFPPLPLAGGSGPIYTQ